MTRRRQHSSARHPSHRGYAVAQLDPQTLEFSILAYAEPNPGFNGVSAARIVGRELWLAAYQGDRIAVRALPGAAEK